MTMGQTVSQTAQLTDSIPEREREKAFYFDFGYGYKNHITGLA